MNCKTNPAKIGFCKKLRHRIIQTVFIELKSDKCAKAIPRLINFLHYFSRPLLFKKYRAYTAKSHGLSYLPKLVIFSI